MGVGTHCGGFTLAASSGGGNREEPVAEPHQAAVGALPPSAHRLRRPGGQPDTMVTVHGGFVSSLHCKHCKISSLGRAAGDGFLSNRGPYLRPLNVPSLTVHQGSVWSALDVQSCSCCILTQIRNIA